VLPVFNHDGSLMMWTAQRGPLAPGENRPSSQLWVARIDTMAVRQNDDDKPGPEATPGNAVPALRE
jgi:hypothetical protein